MSPLGVAKVVGMRGTASGSPAVNRLAERRGGKGYVMAVGVPARPLCPTPAQGVGWVPRDAAHWGATDDMFRAFRRELRRGKYAR